MIRQGFFSLLIVAAVGVLLLSLVNELAPTRRDLPENAHLAPDVILENADLRSYSLNGALEYHVLAERVEHRVSQGETLITLPILALHGSTHQWRATAQTGQVSQADRALLLQGSVLIEQQGQDPVTVKTDMLRYELDAQTLTVPGKVDIQHRGGRSRANRLDLDLRHNRLHMGGGVETRYTPGKQP